MGWPVAQATSRARDAGLDTAPTPYCRDSPVLVNDKVVNKRQEVLDLYEAALASRSGEQMRTLNGICLASWTLRRMQENGQAFRKIAVLGIANKSLGVKELFNPGTTDFWCDPKVSEPYAIWMRQIAKQTVQAKV